MTPRHEELVQRALDGDVTPQEAAELKAALAEDPELARFAQALNDLDRRLRSLPEAEAPGEIRTEVLAAIRPTHTHALAPAARRRRDLIFFLAGAAATAILTVGLTRWGSTVREADSAALTLPSSADSQPIEIDGMRLGELRWTPSSNGPSFELRWHSTTPASLELELDPAAASTLRVRVGTTTNSIPLGASDSAP